METKKEISKELKFKGNPRKISDEQKELLKLHIEELGDLAGVVYCRTNEAYVSGNQRSDIFDTSAIEIVEEYKKPNKQGTIAYGFINHDGERFAYREVQFNDKKFKKACIVANNDGGDNDEDILSTWDLEDLEEWGIDTSGFDTGEDNGDENNYTQKIESPHYEPQDEKPNLSELYNDAKTNELIEEIDSSPLDKKEKDFLKLAAFRHTVFNYQKIADFYANSSPEAQSLMESSALVIIDFDKAIEKGYVKLSDQVADSFKLDYEE
jgi:hypothetical protein